MSSLARLVLDLVFPPRCLGCATLGTFFCTTCTRSIHALPEPLCLACRQPVAIDNLHQHRTIPDVEFVLAGGDYRDSLREAIHRFKYGGMHAGALDLAALLTPRLTGVLATDLLVAPVPLHPRKQRERGYNQAALLARALMRERQGDLNEHALRRVRHTTPQAQVPDRAARARNMEGAFVADSQICAGRTILLVDDVCTTGATLRNAALAARAAGARHVYATVLAITPQTRS